MLPTGPIVSGVHRIAVLRANGLGDFIFALPALAALRAAYPSAELVLLAKPWHASFLAERPTSVDSVIAVPRSRGVNGNNATEDDSAALDQFFERMRERQFDLALQLHGGGRFSNPFVLDLAARITAGLKTPDAPPLDRWVPYVYFQQEVLRYLEVVALVGASASLLEPRLTVTPRDIAESLRVVPETDGPLVVLHPGATDPGRRWPARKFAAVGDALSAHGAQVAVIGTPDEQEVVDAVMSAMRTGALDLCGRLSLNGLTGLLARASVVIANDSGPLHLAAAVGAATVGIYWCFNFVNAGPFSRTRHRPAIAWTTRCPVCGIDRASASCDHHASFVASVPVEEVLASASDLLADPQPALP